MDDTASGVSGATASDSLRDESTEHAVSPFLQLPRELRDQVRHYFPIPQQTTNFSRYTTTPSSPKTIAATVLFASSDAT